jgi:iron complex outermembrane recepter protein
VVTRKPTGEAGVRGNLRLGNRDTIRSLTNVDLPAWGDLAAKFTVLASNKDGWVKNAGGADYGQNEQLAGQASLRWTPGTRLTVDYSFDVGRVDSTALYYINPALVGYLPGYVVDRKRTYRPIDLPETRMTFNGHALTVELQASDAITLRSLTGYRHLDATTVQDYNEIYSTPATRRVTSVRPFDVIRSRQYSQELQLVGSFGERVNAVAGLYYFREKANHFQNVRTLASALNGPVTTINLNRDTDATSKSIAAYGQFSWTPPVLDDRLELTVGARYTEDRRFAARLQQTITTLPSGLDVPGAVEDVANRQRFRRFNPSFTVNFRPTPDLTLYGKVATGYRAGGSDEGALVFQTPHGPEDVVSYEVGLKADVFERRLRANLAAFTMDYEDVQISFLPSTAASSTFQTLNAGRGRISGFEADLSAAPVEALRLNASYAYLSTDLKSVDVAAGTILDPAINPLSSFRVGQNVANQFAFAFAPKHSLSLSGDLTLARFGDDTLALFGNYQWKSKAYATGGAGSAIVGRDNTAIPAFGTADARLTYRHARASGGFVSFALWSRNITDEDYKAHVIATGSGLSGYTGQIFAYGEPRTYGAEVGFEF